MSVPYELASSLYSQISSDSNFVQAQSQSLHKVKLLSGSIG